MTTFQQTNLVMKILVDELYAGQWFMTPAGNQFVKCMLVCLSSDIPATRKTAGFVGHNTFKACSHLKHFPRVGDQSDYSRFNRAL